MTDASSPHLRYDSSSGAYTAPDPATGQRRVLSAEQAVSRVPEFRKQHPAIAAYFRPKPFDPDERSFSYQAGAWLRKPTGAVGRWFGNVGNSGMLPAAGIGALAGAAGGALLGKLQGMATGEDATGRYALLAALAGLGLGGYLGYSRQKSASVFGYKDDEDPDALRTAIATYLRRDPSLSTSDRLNMVAELQQLSLRELLALKQKLALAGGAAAGAVAARFLFGPGWIPAVLGAAAGGWLANRLNSGAKQTAAGSPFASLF